MLRPNLIVAIGSDDHRGHAINPAANEAQQVERGFVRPVDIFEHNQHRLWTERQERQKCAEYVVQLPRFAQEPIKLATHQPGNVHEWPERPGSRERITRATKHARCRHGCSAEFLDEDRLANTSFTSNKDEPTMAIGGRAQKFI